MNSDQASRYVGIDMLRPGHALALQQLASDPALTGSRLLPRVFSIEGVQEFIDRCAQERAADQSFVHAVMDRKTLVGLCGLLEVSPRESAELEFWIGQPFWGKGLATFATGNMLDFGFGPLRLERVSCRPLERSLAARHVLERHGFRFVRTELCQTPEINCGASFACYEVAPRGVLRLQTRAVSARFVL